MNRFVSEKWRSRFAALAEQVATWSKDPSTKVGCVLASPDGAVLSSGYNGLPRGVADKPERMERPAKYLWTVHAEAAAIANAARLGARTEGAMAFVTHPCCAGCARLLINAGVQCVMVGSGKTSMPAEEFETAATMFREADISAFRLEDGRDL